MSQQESQSENNKWKTIMKWSGLGVEFAGVIILFCYFGYKLDEKFQTSPWFLLAGFFLGFIGMLYIIIKDTRNLWRD
ncbi:MAG: AtpZ/AtpI family protein [Sedimentisphaerales bacterium]|jgi:F0F1-type ATP synthase assembly protein I